jgi:kynurenine formamidase
MGQGLRELQHVRLIDLSVPISSGTAELFPPHIDYVDHSHAAQELAGIASKLIRAAYPHATDIPVITQDSFRDGLGLANENLQIDTHAGTHIDAPWHFGPSCENKPSKTIDQIPLEWCWGPGVVLDLRHKRPGEVITIPDLQEALHRISYSLQPGNIVLLMTGADKHFGQADYFSAHPGMGREATLWLVDQGIRVIGTDGWGFDRPANAMIQEYIRTKDSASLLPAHMAGRDREYCHIEKLAHLDKLPIAHGFWFCCFPIKVERGSAGWIRAVALVEESQ